MEEGVDPQGFLQQLRADGVLDSAGVFTENTQALFERLAARLFEEPEDYLLCFFQALCCAGASAIEYEVSSHWVELRCDDGMLEPLQGDWPALAINPEAGVRRFLAAGVVGAWSTHTEITIESRRRRSTYRPAQGSKPEIDSTRLKGTRIVLTRAQPVLVPRRRPQPRLLAYPIPIRVSVPLLGTSHLQDASYSSQAEPLLLPDAEPRPDNITSRLEGAYLMGHGRLAVPEALAGAPIVWREKPETPCFTALSNQGRTWYPVRQFLLLRRPLSGPSYLIAVEAGVALRPLQVDLGYDGLVLVCSLEDEGLAADLSGSQLRQGPALEAFLTRMREALPNWMEAFAAGVDAWKPGLGHSSNPPAAFGGAFIGFMSGVVFFAATGVTIFPPILMAGGAYLGDRTFARWKKQQIQSDLREALEGHRSEPSSDGDRDRPAGP